MKPASHFTHIKHPNYRNINEIETCTNRLHNLESLFGDQEAKVLILLQDAAHFERFLELKRSGNDIFRHGENVLTNKRLVKIFSHKYPLVDIKGTNARSCGLFGANAIWLLKSGGMSARINDMQSVLESSRAIFDETISSLPNLRLVIAFGNVAFNSLNFYLGTNENWRNTVTYRSFHKVTYLNRIFYFTASVHPAARGNYRESISKGESNPWALDVNCWFDFSLKGTYD